MSLLSRLAVQAARAYGMLVSGATTNVPANFLVVAGGGGAGDDLGGAGGGGGLRTSAGASGGGASAEPTITLSTLNTYSIVVGSGGAGATAGGANGTNGGNSVISGTGLTTITSVGGGGGAGDGTGGGIGTAQSGGSGGGAASGSGYAGGAGTANQGFAGGSNPAGSYQGASAGGGGAGAAGTGRSGSTNTGGNGGNGVQSSISGTATYYAGGGAGGTGTGGTAGTAGLGGGGTGSTGSGNNGGNGGTNLGGGGGGGSASGANGGNGGSGIVIISYTSATPKFVGGTITTSGGNQIHTFTSSGTLSPITPITASYLVVAGGGGGATNTSAGASGGVGGGGAGGLLTSSTTLYSGATYIVTVGAGGAGGTTSGASGSQGSTSSLGGTGLTTISTTGGGFGAGTIANNGGAGGSGGGGYGFPLNTYNGGAGTSGQGNAGARGFTDGTTYTTGGGGGGAGAAATQKTNNSGGDGGIGITSSITGTSTYYAGGGGGGAGPSGSGGTGGLGGGGNGSVAGASASAGTPNTGGGGGGVGGGSSTVFTGGNGGSGTVIISYAGSQQFNGGLVTTSGGNTIHTFTSSGALTPLTNNLTNSLRFRSSASANLARTPTVAGNRRTYTWSAWVKRGALNSGGSDMTLFNAGTTSPNYDGFRIKNDTISFFQGGAVSVNIESTQVFRDPSAWYHFVLAVDTTQATAANRVKIFVNGNQITAFSTASYPAQNAEAAINNTFVHNIAAQYANTSSSAFFDGYMDDIYFIDGQALEPYFFGNNDANGVWKPIQYRGTYGINGFYLNFSNTTSTTTLGFDSSPNGNNWTTNNISLTAGVTYDAMTDVPTNTSATVANYPVISPLTGVTPTGGNLNLSGGDVAGLGTMAFPSTGKWYFEMVCGSGVTTTSLDSVGIGTTDINGTLPANKSVYMYRSNGNKLSIINGGSSTQVAYGATFVNGDVIGVAFDCDADTLTFYKNNTTQGTAFTSILSSTPSTPFFLTVYARGSGGTSNVSLNAGQRPFAYTPPTGFVALNTFNLPTPTILQGNRFMDATLYTGNGSSQTIVNQGQFRPDFVWIKRRDGAGQDHVLQDSNRGFGGTTKLASSSTAAENTTGGATGSEWGFVTAANSNGFNITASTSGDQVNKNTWTYVGWQWQAGQGTNTTNTAGSITSTVSVNTTAGFSVVTYTGTGANATVGHGLGVAPRMVIVKRRNSTGDWLVWNSVIAANNAANVLFLNDIAAQSALSTNFNSTAPTSTVFSVGTNPATNASGGTHVAYCWAEIAGFSRFGSYTGNGSANGTFVYTGFQPEFIMWKRTDAIENWGIWTPLANGNGIASNNNFSLFPNLTAAQDTTQIFDTLSNGFKNRDSGSLANANGGTYIYMAFAINPFKISNAR